MCGIVGYIGKRQAADLLVEGLSKLEYRGYDSAGVAIIEDEKISVRKLKGRLMVNWKRIWIPIWNRYRSYTKLSWLLL